MSSSDDSSAAASDDSSEVSSSEGSSSSSSNSNSNSSSNDDNVSLVSSSTTTSSSSGPMKLVPPQVYGALWRRDQRRHGGGNNQQNIFSRIFCCFGSSSSSNQVQDDDDSSYSSSSSSASFFFVGPPPPSFSSGGGENNYNDNIHKNSTTKMEEVFSTVGSEILNFVGIDITLVGSDGSKIGSNKGMLAVRSQYFERMFFGHFQEANNSEEIKLPFDGDILKAVVEFIYTGGSAPKMLLSLTKELTTDNNNKKKIKKFKALMDRFQSIKQSADFFGLPGLVDIIKTTVSSIISSSSEEEEEVYSILPGLEDIIKTTFKDMIISSSSDDPSMSFALLQTSRDCKEDEFAEIALSNIRKQWKGDLPASNNMLRWLSASVVEDIISDNNLFVKESDLFMILVLWTVATTTTTTKTIKDRISIAKDFVGKHIALELIHPMMLSTFVRPSGLATEEQLAKAFEAQALYFEKANINDISIKENGDIYWHRFEQSRVERKLRCNNQQSSQQISSDSTTAATSTSASTRSIESILVKNFWGKKRLPPLVKIRPSDLSIIVRSSGTVTEDQLAEAFEAQALFFGNDATVIDDLYMPSFCSKKDPKIVWKVFLPQK